MGSIAVDDYDNNTKAAHVLFIPVETQGHVAPLLRLAIQLARKGITVTFVTSEEAFSRITLADDELSSELQRLDFRFVAIVPVISQSEGKGWRYKGKKYREAFEPVLEKLVHDRSAGIAGPTSIISDLFLAWTQDVADELRIPKYMFCSSGVIFVRAMMGVLHYFESGQFQASETDGSLLQFDWLVCLSGLPPLRYHELPRSLRRDPGEFRVRSEAAGRSAGILVNAFLELEEKVTQIWTGPAQPGFEHFKVPKMYPVGPLFPTSVALQNVGGLEDSASKCLHWLGLQPPSSVLYVAFGSQCCLPPEQILELAHGLENSRQRFLWVLPQPKGGSEAEAPSTTELLPPGFEARVGDRGCIVTGWAPQVQILAHRSTACFLTHSGWNSSLESITLGVPMISWPQAAEQHLNCRYLVDDLKVACQLRTGAENVLRRDEVERVVRLLMVEPEGEAIKSRTEELKRKAAATVAEGGSQSRVFMEFVEDVRNDALGVSNSARK